MGCLRLDSPEAEPEMQIHGKGFIEDVLPEELYKETGVGVEAGQGQEKEGQEAKQGVTSACSCGGCGV